MPICSHSITDGSDILTSTWWVFPSTWVYWKVPVDSLAVGVASWTKKSHSTAISNLPFIFFGRKHPSNALPISTQLSVSLPNDLTALRIVRCCRGTRRKKSSYCLTAASRCRVLEIWKKLSISQGFPFCVNLKMYTTYQATFIIVQFRFCFTQIAEGRY